MIEPQKCLHLYKELEKKKPNINHDYILTRKVNGIYTYIDYKDGHWGRVTSIRGRETPALAWATSLFQTLEPPKGNFRFIFESLIPGVPFEVGSGILNRSVGDCAAKEVEFWFHDMVDLDDFWINKPANTARGRLTKLYTYLGNELSDKRHLENKLNILQDIYVTDVKDTWYEVAETLIAGGEEGICLKAANSIYQPGKRNSSLMKIKQEETVYLECVSLQYTTGEKGNPSLQLILRSKDKIEVPVRVGKHEDVAFIEEDNNRVLGKVIAVEIMCRNYKGGLTQPRLAEKWLTTKSIEELD